MSARCILGCPPKTRAKLVHRFPNPIKYPNQHEAWLKVVPEHKKVNFEYQKRRICDKHFLKKDKYFKGLLNRIAIPTLCLPGQPIEEIRNTVEDEHNYTTTITEHRKPIRYYPISLLEKEHDYHSKPQEVDKTIDYVHESGNATSTCIKLLDRYDDFGKIGEPTVIEDATNINTYTLEETLNNFSDKPQPVLSDADVVKVEIEETKPQNKNGQNRKTKKKYFSSTTKESNFKDYMAFIENTSEQNNAQTSTISNSNKQSNVTGQVSLVSDATVTKNISSAKSIQNTKTLQKIQNNIVYSVLKSGRNVFLSNCIKNANISKLLQENTETSTMPKICMTDSDELCISDNDFPNNAIDRQTVVPQPVVSNADIADLETEKTNIVEINSDRLCISNDFQSNVTGQVQQNTSSAKTIQNTQTLHKIQNNIVYSVLKSGRNIFLSNSIGNANISKLLQENIETSTMPKICLTDINSDELYISDNDFSNNAIGRRTVVPQPVLSNADLSDLETENTSISEINSDRLCISNDLQSNVTGKVQPLVSDARVTENNSSVKAIQNTKTFHKIQNNGPCKQSDTSAHFATLKSGCNVLNTNSIRNANISKFLHENTETSTISNICLAETNSDELYISDNEFPNNAIGRRTVVPQPVLSNAHIADLETENTSIAESNSNTLIPVRIYNEENSTSGSRPGSPKRAKLDISELDEYRIVGSTTIVTGLFASDEIQPLEDPLAIHSPIKGDMGINDCVGLNEDSMGSVEDSMGTVKDNTSIYKEGSHPVDSIKINNKDSMAHFDDKEYELNDSIYINNEDELEIAYALKFIFKQGKTAKQAFEEIMTTYGPGKMSLKEAECWYRELEIGNDVMRIISSGGPVYK